VPHKALTAILNREMGIGCQAFREFGFDSLGQKLARSVSQNLGERIGKLSRLAQGDNLIVLHGVSILLWMCGWLVTATIRRFPYSASSPAHMGGSGSRYFRFSSLENLCSCVVSEV
jgi:hypothetical protein